MRKFSWMICSVFVTVCLMFVLPTQVHATEIIDRGTCGEDVVWTLDDEGTLTISGIGAMTDFGYKEAPWYSSRDAVKTVIIDNGVTSIGGYAFQDCSLVDITIPEGVTSIGYSAFEGCSNLTSVRIPDSVTIIDDGAFAYCSSLASIEIPGSITSLDSTFYKCEKLKSVSLNEGLTHIRGGTFYMCNLTEIRIPDSVVYILGGAFDSCSALTSVTIGKGVTEIGSNAFGNCANLERFYVDEANASFSSDSFGGLYNKDKTKLIQCPSANKGRFEVPDGVTEIGPAAFAYCSSLSSVSIPSSVTNIASGAFSYTYGFMLAGGDYYVSPADGAAAVFEIQVSEDNTAYSSENGVLYNKSKSVLLQIPSRYAGQLTIPESVRVIGENAAAFCSELTGITIPDTVTEIGKYAFYKCSLEMIDLPNQLTSIKEGTFYRSSITGIVIPDGVTVIEVVAFSSCTGLISITIPESITTIDWSAFNNSDALAYVYYYGDETKWNAVSVDPVRNDSLLNAKIYYNADESVTGDFTGDLEITSDDVVQLLLHVSMPDVFPITADADFTGDGKVTSDDVVQLLLHVSMPDIFPLQVVKKEDLMV